MSKSSRVGIVCGFGLVIGMFTPTPAQGFIKNLLYADAAVVEQITLHSYVLPIGIAAVLVNSAIGKVLDDNFEKKYSVYNYHPHNFIVATLFGTGVLLGVLQVSMDAASHTLNPFGILLTAFGTGVLLGVLQVSIDAASHTLLPKYIIPMLLTSHMRVVDLRKWHKKA